MYVKEKIKISAILLPKLWQDFIGPLSCMTDKGLLTQ